MIFINSVGLTPRRDIRSRLVVLMTLAQTSSMLDWCKSLEIVEFGGGKLGPLRTQPLAIPVTASVKSEINKLRLNIYKADGSITLFFYVD